MAILSYTTLGGITAGAANTASDVTTAFTQAQTAINSVDKEQLSTANAQLLGMNNGSNVGRGKSIIATTESRTNTAYGTLATPDQVTGIVLPTDGLIFVMYQATWQASVSSAARAAIFIGSNQLKVQQINSGPVVQAAVGPGTTGLDTQLASFPFGLAAGPGSTASDVTTGQVCGVAPFVSGSAFGAQYEIGSTQFDTASGTAYASGAPVGGPCTVFAAAGTYTISVQFKSTSGSVTAKNRKLWVWTMGF